MGVVNSNSRAKVELGVGLLVGLLAGSSAGHFKGVSL